MHRRDFIRTAMVGGGAALGGVALAAPAIAQSAPELEWRLASSYPRSLDALFGAAELFAQAVTEATDGRFRIRAYPADEIAPAATVADAVGEGTVEMAHTASYYYADRDPTFALFTAVPFGLNSRQQNAWMYEAGGIDLMNGFFHKFNFHGLPGGNTGAQMGGWFRREIDTVEDLRGLRMRIPGLAGQLLSRFGVEPRQLLGDALLPALEAGEIDAAEWVGPYDDEKLGLQKAAPYYYYPAWWEGGGQVQFLINLDRWNALPPAYRRAIETAAGYVNGWMLARYDALNAPALRRLVAGGAQLRPFPSEVMSACFEEANTFYAELVAGNADFAAGYEAMRAVRGDGYLWFQIAEYTYDTFMMIQQRAGAL